MSSAPGTDLARAALWLRAHQGIVRGWVFLAAAAGIAATACHALFAFALAHTLSGWLDSPALPHSLIWLATMPAVLLLRSALVAVREWAGLRAGLALRTLVRQETMDTLERLGPLRTAHGTDGALATDVIEQVDALGDYAARYLPQRLIVVGVPVLLVMLALPHSWLAAMLWLATAPPVPLFMTLIGRGAAAASQHQAEALARLGGRFLDLVRGLPTLRLLGRADDAIHWLASDSNQYRERTMGVLRLAFLSSAVLELFASLAIALVALYLGLALLGRFEIGHYGQPMTLQSALFLLLLAPEFFAPLRQLGADYHARASALAAAGQLARLQDALPASDLPPAHHSTQTPDDASHFIVLENIGLRHADGRIALDAIRLRIDVGDRIEVRGASGSGKSTLLALLAGLIPPTCGQIRIDGTTLTALELRHWWAQLGWLEQRPEWFRLSIRENVLLGLPDEARSRLWPALEAAGLDDVIRALPNAQEAIPGENGTLSGGQMQRLALARALARDARLWLLDEPFAQLDPDTAAHLRETIAQSTTGRTVLLASHQPDTPSWINRRLTLSEGRLIADQRRDADGQFR